MDVTEMHVYVLILPVISSFSRMQGSPRSKVSGSCVEPLQLSQW